MQCACLRRIYYICLALILPALYLSACNLPSYKPSPTANKGLVITQVAQTVQAKIATPTPVSRTPLPTTAAPPTSTPQELPQSTPTPLPPTIPVSPTIRANLNTNCRAGPATSYPIVGVFLEGQQSTVRGRNANNTWWFIENPGKPDSNCWVWGESTVVQGDILSLPIVTPPPEPTLPPGANVAVGFSNIHNCNGLPTAIFMVLNKGNETLKSVSLAIIDATSNIPLFGPVAKNAPFMIKAGDCPWGGFNLKAGETGYIGGSLGPSAKSKHTALASIMICTEKGLVGDCASSNIQFKIP